MPERFIPASSANFLANGDANTLPPLGAAAYFGGAAAWVGAGYAALGASAALGGAEGAAAAAPGA